MKLSKQEYQRLEDEFLKEQFKLSRPKPNAMAGTYGWYAVTKRTFALMLKSQGVEVSRDE